VEFFILNKNMGTQSQKHRGQATREVMKRGKKDFPSCFLNDLFDVKGSRGGGIEIREDGFEVVGMNGSTVKECSTSYGGLSFCAESQISIAESTHGGSQSDINDVISGSSSIGISSKISSENTKSALVS